MQAQRTRPDLHDTIQPTKRNAPCSSRRPKSRRLPNPRSPFPGPVYWLLLATLAVLVVVLGLCLPAAKSLTVTATLVTLTALLTCILLAVRDVERPFSGIIQIKPAALTALEDNISRDYTAAYQHAGLPCTERGTKRTA
ncbi:bestrophin-like domain [Streptomyces cinnamoneus]|uniref:bestrophin-like domain n=1 Tax=Streptomyces cinnamoneus TaxID=53446 RepID=UPI00379DD130